MKSSFDGNIREIPYISVDNFTEERRAYFLSHCHTDHTEGLYTDEFLNYLITSGDVFIYMSEPSAAIVAYETKNEKLLDYIKPLPLEPTTILIPALVAERIPEQYITVTLIPAGHCFGSVMFLYKTQFKTVLYTGDFRMNPDYLPEYIQFYENNSVIDLDTLYIDTTFQNHVNLPKRLDTIKYVLKEVGDFVNQGGCVALHTSAKYGYEDVCNQIYDKLGFKVYVGEAKWKLYSKFPIKCRGMTNDYKQTPIHICTNWNENISHDKCLPLTETRPCLYFHFSALKWSKYHIDELMIDKNDKKIDVCYPTHCSKSELLYFVNYFKIGRVVGFPKPFWSLEKKEKEKEREVKRKSVETEIEVPDKVPKLVDEALLREIFGDL